MMKEYKCRFCPTVSWIEPGDRLECAGCGSAQLRPGKGESTPDARDPRRILAPSTKDPKKTPYHLVDFDFVAELAQHMKRGIDQDPRRRAGDWKRIKWTGEEADNYRDAVIRHLREGFDPVAVAANAMILWYHEERDGGPE